MKFFSQTGACFILNFRVKLICFEACKNGVLGFRRPLPSCSVHRFGSEILWLLVMGSGSALSTSRLDIRRGAGFAHI